MLSHCSYIQVALKCRATEREHLNHLSSCWTFLFCIIYCSDSDIFLLYWSLHLLLRLRTSSKMPCVALSSPLHFHALVSLSSVFFLLITSHFIYDRTQENCFQVLICISWTLSLALLPLFLPSFPALIILPPSLSPSFLSVLWSVLCGSSSMSEEKHTLIPISALWRIHNMRRPEKDIWYLSLSFFPLLSTPLHVM